MKKISFVADRARLDQPFCVRPRGRAAQVTARALGGRAIVAMEASPGCFGRWVSLRYAAFMLFLATLSLRADQVEMQNGDRYLGTVLALDTNTLVLRSAVLCTVNLPRGQVVLITLGSGGATNFTRAASATKRQPAASSIAITNGM